ncbi:hypothetical protein ACOMHN_050789 [Nucella lapillus]
MKRQGVARTLEGGAHEGIFISTWRSEVSAIRRCCFVVVLVLTLSGPHCVFAGEEERMMGRPCIQNEPSRRVVTNSDYLGSVGEEVGDPATQTSINI